MHKAISSSVPTRVTQLAAEHQLGALDTIYHRHIPRWLSGIWIFLIVILFVGYLSRLIIDWQFPSRSPLFEIYILISIVIIYLLIALLSAFGLNPLQDLNRYFCAFAQGFIFVDGKTAQTIHWNEIESIVWTRQGTIEKLVLENGKNLFELSRTSYARQISQLIAQRIENRLFSSALQTYQSQGKVRFGLLSLMHEGVAYFDQTASWESFPLIPWSDIQDARFAHGKIALFINGQWRNWKGRIRNIPNPTIFVSLVKHLQTGRF